MENSCKLLGTLESKIVGVRYYRGGLDAGERVLFKRDPLNVHDANAIEALNFCDEMVGHVPREHAAFLAPLLDRGRIVLSGLVDATDSAESDWFIPLQITVSLTPKGEALLLAPNANDSASAAHRRVLELFREWGGADELRRFEILAECEALSGKGPETDLLICLMGGEPGNDVASLLDEFSEYSEADAELLAELTQAEPGPDVEEAEGREEQIDAFALKIDQAARQVSLAEKLEFIMKYGDFEHRLILRGTIDELVDEILDKNI